MAAPHGLPDALRRNIDRVLRLEEHASQSTGLADSVAASIGNFVGTIPFALVHAVAFGGWVTANATGWLGRHPPDPYPYNLLSTFASCEAVVLAAFVLLTQNRTSALADRRDHLDLQVNLTVEQETSMIIQMLDRISAKLDIPVDEAAVHLSHTSTLERLAEELHQRFPNAEQELPKE